MIMRNVFACGLAVIGLTGAAWAQDIGCNSTYTTVRGDSLSDIAQRAYDDALAYAKIFELNPTVLTSPNVVPIGVDLFVPCLDDEKIEVFGELQPIRPSQSDGIRILTGADYAPYVDRDLPNGGFSTELVERAMQYNGQPADYRIDVIADWGAHLSPLLADGLYDLGYPWFRPDCSEYDRLGEASRWRCDNLLFSRPLHEIVISFYGRAGEVEEIREPADAAGLTICRPSGYFTHDLEAAGLIEPANPRVAPMTPQDCFEMLAARTVDLVTLNADTSDGIIREMQMGDRIAEVIELSTVQTLHVVGVRDNPRTRILLRRVDQGLRNIHDNGLFRKIAASHL